MIDLDIKWTDPVQIEKDGNVLFQREWMIPSQYRTQFFNYWKANRFTLKEKGYGVYKKEEDWVLTETKENPTFFKEPKKPDDVRDVKTEPPLPLYEVKNPEGLRPWQVEAVSKLVSSIKKWGAAVDGSDV